MAKQQEKKRPKRGNGEGSIRYLEKEGLWSARIMVGYNEKGKPKYETFSSKQRNIAAKKLADFIANKKDEMPEVICKDTLAKWLNRWLEEYVKVNVALSTRISYEGIVKNQIIPHIGGIKLNELKKVDIEKMYSQLLVSGNTKNGGGLSVKTVDNVALCLHKALEVAVEREYISKNPASIAKVPTLKSTNSEKTEIEILTKAEQQALMAVCDNNTTYGMAIYTTLHTGLRIGELLAIKWSDIDFEEKTISITKQLNRLHDYSPDAPAKTRLGIQNNTKTKSSTRFVSINDDLLARLLRYRKQQKENILKWGAAYNNMDMVFAREDGNYFDPDTFRDRYRQALSQAGLKPYKFHALRHTFATRALEAGIAIKVVSRILGHASVQITMDTYMHLLPELQHESMNKIAAYIVA